MTDILILGLAVGTASTTITQSKIFRWLQEGIGRAHPLLHDLFSCAYCMGHWLAALAVALWYPISDDWVNTGVTWLAVTGTAALVSGLIGLLFSKTEGA